MRKIRNYILMMLFAGSMLFENIIGVQAATDEAIKTSIMRTSALLKTRLEADYAEAEEELKSIIRNGGYDYQLSMESYYEQKNPMIDMDITEIMALYAVAKDAEAISGIDDLKVFEAAGSEGTESYVRPEKIDLYEKNPESNTFKRAGYEYVTVRKNVPVFEKTGQYEYVKTGTMNVTPKKVEVTVYLGRILLKTADQIMEELGLSDEKYIQDFTRRKQILNRILSGRGLSQGVFIRLPESMDQFEIKDCSENRRTLLESATSLIGQVPYYWGGKPSHPGYDNTWWTINEAGEQNGLDCSGFVEWALMDAGYPKNVWSRMTSTAQILKNADYIAKEDLIPGDLGLLNTGGGINHVGIYAGDGVFVHCSSAAGTVVAQKYDNFKIFVRIPNIDEMELQKQEAQAERRQYHLSDDDLDLLAKTVSHEAKGEGINGWIGVTQVILNRMDSELFPNSVKEVVYAKNQFEGSEKIEDENPDPKLKQVVEMVCSGTLSVFDRNDILYFRNSEQYGSANWDGHSFVRNINRHGFYSQN